MLDDGFTVEQWDKLVSTEDRKPKNIHILGNVLNDRIRVPSKKRTGKKKFNRQESERRTTYGLRLTRLGTDLTNCLHVKSVNPPKFPS